MPITPLPTPPSRADSANFASRADSFLAALPTFATEANATATEVNGYSTSASNSAAAATAASAAAVSATNITQWISGTTYALGVVVWSPVNQLAYRRKVAGAGTTDPSADSTNWTLIAGTGDVTQTGTQTLTNKTITGLLETRNVISASNINLSAGNYFTRTISGATTFTVSNVPAAGTAASFILDLTNGGSATITWWSNVRWANGTAPTLTAAGRDVLGFYTHDAGANWTGLLLGRDVK
jgi:hypothetical protein